MATIPIVTELAIEEFAGGVVTIPVSMCTNVVYGKRPSGNIFATQRPGINTFEDASATVADAAGRGVYYWGAVGSLYIVNHDTVYRNNYSTPLAVNVTAGTERVEIFEVGDYLMLLDIENNEGWYIDSAAPTVLAAIADLDFPPNQTPAKTLARGGAELNKTGYVYTTDGEIYNSATEDPTSWALLDVINSEVRADGGVLLSKHTGHLAALGERSMEFFGDIGNPTGSTLSVRQDVVHDIGTVDHNTFYGDANASYFVGKSESGDLGVYLLQNFAISKISEPDLDSLLTMAIIADGVKAVGSGFSAGGRGFYILTLYNINSGVVNPETTFVYDSSTGFWNPWEHASSGIDSLPLVDWTRSGGTRSGTGILSNGDIVTILDDFNPVDSVEAQVYVLTDYVEPGYITDTSASGDIIPMEIITGQGSFGTQNDKFMGNLRIKGTPTTNSQTLTVQWSDEGNDNYNTGRTIDISNPKNKLNRCGKFKTRNFKLSYAGSEQIEIEAIEGDING